MNTEPEKRRLTVYLSPEIDREINQAVQAIKQGGDRSYSVSSLLEDAARAYLSDLKRKGKGR